MMLRFTDCHTPTGICSAVINGPEKVCVGFISYIGACIPVCSPSFVAEKMKGTEVPNPRHSSACDCTCVLTRIDHCPVNNTIMTFALKLIWHVFRYQFIPNCLCSNLF